jgi:hypothetical protein
MTDGWVSLDPADIGLADAVYKRNIREGEERLMLAVGFSLRIVVHSPAMANSYPFSGLVALARSGVVDKNLGDFFIEMEEKKHSRMGLLNPGNLAHALGEE